MKKNRLAASLLALLLLFPVFTWGTRTDAGTADASFSERTALSAQLAEEIRAAVDSAKVNNGLSPSDSLLGSERYTESASSTATDWMALAMGRFGYFGDDGYRYLLADGDGYAAYLAAMKTYLETTYEEEGGLLDRVKSTEWHRAAVTVAALGGDPTAFGTYGGEPINLIADGSYDCAVPGGPGRQDLNAWIWGLIALDAELYDVPDGAKYPRETFVVEILKAQFPDGGWALGGYAASDADMTGMALQALAPYYNDETVYTYRNAKSGQTVSKTVRQCVKEALDRLGEIQQSDGGFLSPFGDGEAAESTAQVLTALCSLGIDPAEDPRFLTADGKTLLDNLLLFQTPEGGFRHTRNGGWNAMATAQATYALVSYWRLENGMRALFDMRGDRTQAEQASVDAAEAQIDALPPISADPTYKGALKAALAAFRIVPPAERRYVYHGARLLETVAFVGGEEALDDPALPYRTSIAVTRKPDKTAYTEGERFDPTGMVVTARFSDGTEEPVTDYRYAPAGLLTREDAEIQIVYGILKASLPIAVTTAPDLQIGTVEEFLQFRDSVNAGNNFKGKVVTLTADLDLSGEILWSPVANKSGNAFEGTFDGGYHVLENLFSMTKGVFGYAGPNAVIRNLGLESSTILTSSGDVGGIVSVCNGASVVNCWNGADITFLGYSSYGGGVVGVVRTTSGGLISGCYNTGAIHAKDGPVGGVVGYLTANAGVTVENCYNTGEISLDENGWWAGGVVGKMQDNNVLRNCYAVGEIKGEESGAVVAAVTRNATVENCYYDRETFANATGDGTHAEEIVGMTSRDMQAPDFAARLQGAYKADPFGFVNGGYPLLHWQKTEKADAIRAVVEKIEAIGTVTPGSADAIQAARRAYDALDEELKPYLSDSLQTLERAEETWAALLQNAKDDAKKALRTYKTLSDYRAEQQAELQTLLTEFFTRIDAAADVNAVDTVVAEAKAMLDAVKTAKECSDEEDAKRVSERIAGIGKVTLERKDAVEAARREYDALSDEAKALVGNYDALLKAEAELEKLESETGADSSPAGSNDPVSESSDGAESAPSAPQTGDTNDLPPYVVLLAVGLCGLLLLARAGRNAG